MSRDVEMDAHFGVSRGSYAGRIEVLGSPAGRRQRSDGEKGRIATDSLAPDAVVADLARRHGAARWQIYDWRRRFPIGRLAAPEDTSASPVFGPLTVDDRPRTTRRHLDPRGTRRGRGAFGADIPRGSRCEMIEPSGRCARSISRPRPPPWISGQHGAVLVPEPGRLSGRLRSTSPLGPGALKRKNPVEDHLEPDPADLRRLAAPS